MTKEQLLNAKEGEHIQFKEANRRFSADETAKICCALANGGGGRLVLGVSDKRPRKVVGSAAFDQPERTRLWLIDKLQNQVDFTEYRFDGKRVLVFEAAPRPRGIPIQCDGIAWWYVGDRLEPLPEEVRRQIYAEGEADFSASICSGATLDDLDPAAIDAFRNRWIEKSGNQRLQSLSHRQLLFDCDAVTADGITYAALILFGTPQALKKYLAQSEIVFEYRNKETAGPASQREKFRCGFFSSFDRLWELIDLRNDKQHYQDGFFVGDISMFNEQAVREAVLNAVSHRDYRHTSSVFVRQYKDRLVIESPGGLPYSITLDNILDRQNPRNRRIAELFELCGLVERAGQGINLIYEKCVQEAKALPDFLGTDANYVVITLSGLVLDPRMVTMIDRMGAEKLASLTTADFLIIHALYWDRPLNVALRSRLKRLTELGIVEHVGRGKYVLAESLYAAAGKAGEYTRRMGLSKAANKELLLRHIRDNAERGVPLRELMQVLPGQSRDQLQKILYKLRDENLIRNAGKARAAKWYPVKEDGNDM